MSSNNNTCERCLKTVYPADKFEKYEGKMYHSGCFKCSNEDCGMKLTMRTVKGYNKTPYCDRHIPNDSEISSMLNEHKYVNVRNPLSNEANAQYDEISSISNEHIYVNVRYPLSNEPNLDYDERTPVIPNSIEKQMKTVLKEASDEMIDDVFSKLSTDMHIIICGSPRVGKSTLINAICGETLATVGAGLNSVTQDISCYSKEGQLNTGSNLVKYKYNFWDTPGFESWEKSNIKSKIKDILDKPQTKPVCMIFCASPGTFVNLEQLEWLLDLCILRKHIFCALVCTNKYAGQMKSSQAVLNDFDRLLMKYIDQKPKENKQITFYGNIALTAAVNSEPFESFDRILPVDGVNELIYGIMESLVDEQVIQWCFIVLNNQDFWQNCQEKVSEIVDGFKGQTKNFKKFLKKFLNRK